MIRTTSAAMIAAIITLLSPATGGLTEATTQSTPRTTLTQAEIDNILPVRGPFVFPAPYGTTAIRVTNADRDCAGLDGIWPPGYAAWSNINAHAGRDYLSIFVSLQLSICGTGPALYHVSKKTGHVTPAGSLFPAGAEFNSYRNRTNTEQWYWSPTDPNLIYILEEGLGDSLKRYDVVQQAFLSDAVPAFTSPIPADSYIWQPHTSNDGLVHSFSVRNINDFSYRGCGVYANSTFTYYPKLFTFHDECEIDRSGRWLIIKEDTQGDGGGDVRVIDRDAVFGERILLDADGAGGHGSIGYGFVIMEDNFGLGGAIRKWDFTQSMAGGQPPVGDGQGEMVYHRTNFGESHATWANARPASEQSVDTQQACITGAFAIGSQLARDNEITCFLLNGGLSARVLAPTMIDLAASGDAGSGDDYYQLPFGNVDRYGEWLVWGSNKGRDTIDWFLIRIPDL
jgi:hypothetical protein